LSYNGSKNICNKTLFLITYKEVLFEKDKLIIMMTIIMKRTLKLFNNSLALVCEQEQ